MSSQRLHASEGIRSVFQIEPPNFRLPADHGSANLCRPVGFITRSAQVKTEMRTVLMQMGFEEMPTNQPHSSSCSAASID